MPLKANETLKQYKSRVIDSISPTYCAAKWYNATIWLGHGQTTSCHHPPAHRIDPVEISVNSSAIHNTAHKKLMRKLMLDGQRPNECEYCWKVEQNLTALSDRVYKTVIYTDEQIKQTTEMPWNTNVALKTLEISFERTCNLACSYCNPAFSTTWVKDIKKNGPYTNIVSDGRGHFTDTAPWAENAAEKEEDNPYIQAFWKWWESDLADSLEEIRITGGEPLMAPSVWKLFEWFKDNPERGRKMRFAVNSNLMAKKELMDKLIELSHSIPHLEIYTSCESYGTHAEYIRDGLDYNIWKDNIRRLMTEGNIKSLHCMMTINSLCLPTITEFMTDVLAMRSVYGEECCKMSLNILRFPSFQSCAILPQELKELYRNRLETWFASNKDRLNSWEAEQVIRLIDYLDAVKTPHKNTSDSPKLYNDFRRFYEQYDVRRGKNFRATFPMELVNFINSIQYVEAEVRHDGDPATMEADYVSDEVSHGWDTKNDELGKNE